MPGGLRALSQRSLIDVFEMRYGPAARIVIAVFETLAYTILLSKIGIDRSEDPILHVRNDVEIWRKHVGVIIRIVTVLSEGTRRCP